MISSYLPGSTITSPLVFSIPVVFKVLPDWAKLSIASVVFSLVKISLASFSYFIRLLFKGDNTPSSFSTKVLPFWFIIL